MREHKYRAWDKKTKQMVEVVAIVYSDFQIEADCDDNLGDPVVDEGIWIKIANLIVEHRDFKDVELMQYTCLKDKNDKEICEGDILRIFDRNYEVKIIETGSGVFVDYGYPDKHNGPCNYWSEVIGDIYKNPELMEVEK